MLVSDILVDELSSVPSKIVDFFGRMIEMIASVIEALSTLYEMLKQFDETIVSMTLSAGTSEFTGMPVVESISVFRYLVGDVAFYMIYLTILLGCLMTIYKLVVLLYEAVDALVEQVTGVNCKSLFGDKIGKFFGS